MSSTIGCCICGAMPICFNIDAWSYTAVGTRDDGESPDLELDAQNRPRVAWIADDGSLGYAWCTTACEGDSPQWQTRAIETPAAMEQANPQAIPAHCDQAVWQGIAPTLSLWITPAIRASPTMCRLTHAVGTSIPMTRRAPSFDSSASGTVCAGDSSSSHKG